MFELYGNVHRCRHGRTRTWLVLRRVYTICAACRDMPLHDQYANCSNAAFTPAHQVARNMQLDAGNTQLVPGNKQACCPQQVVARSLLRATSCAGVNAA